MQEVQHDNTIQSDCGDCAILVMLPLNQDHKETLERAAAQAAGQAAGSVGSLASATFIYDENPQPEVVRQAQIIIGTPPVELLEQAENLQWLQLSWAGANQFCVPGALAPDVVLTNASGAYGQSCSEHMLAQTFALIRHLGAYHANQLQGRWHSEGAVISVEGATVAVLGMGDIGGDYARKMAALGAHVIGVKRTPAMSMPSYVERMATIDELDEVLPLADIVGMVLPGGAATHHLMDERRLRLMKPGAYLLNIGRGDAIDPAGLKAVLHDGLLAGVALDVTEPEPLPEDDGLWRDERVLITPHVAGQFFLPATLDKIVDIAADNLARWMQSKPLQHVVDRQLGY